MQQTLGNLKKVIDKLLKEHPELADRKIVLPTDNEGNGYFGMFYDITYDKQTLEDIADSIFDSQETDPDKIVILG